MAKNAQRNKSLLPEILLFVGITLVVVSTTHNVLRARSLSIDKQVVDSYLETERPVEVTPKPLPKHIFIKWYVDVDIEPNVYIDGRWTVSENSGSYLASSGRPGEPGNIIIYGHNKRSILGNLRALKGYETITLTLDDGTTREYKITSIKEVKPSDPTLLKPTDKEVLTLYTCSGILDSQRFVVRAIPSNIPTSPSL